VLSERILKTMTNSVARQDNMKSNFIFAMMALKTLMSSGMPTNKLKRCVVYHSTPKKLPKIDVIRKNAIGLKSD
jgi:hypothetical protein